MMPSNSRFAKSLKNEMTNEQQIIEIVKLAEVG